MCLPLTAARGVEATSRLVPLKACWVAACGLGRLVGAVAASGATRVPGGCGLVRAARGSDEQRDEQERDGSATTVPDQTGHLFPLWFAAGVSRNRRDGGHHTTMIRVV